MPKKKKASISRRGLTSTALQRESARMAVASGLDYESAARLVGITEKEVLTSLREVPDPVFQEMIKVTSRGVLLRSYLKAMAAIDSISDEDLASATIHQKAIVAKAMVDAVDKLSATAQISPEKSHLTLEDVNSLIGSISEKVSHLKLTGVEVSAQLRGNEQITDKAIPAAAVVETDSSDGPVVVSGPESESLATPDIEVD